MSKLYSFFCFMTENSLKPREENPALPARCSVPFNDTDYQEELTSLRNLITPKLQRYLRDCQEGGNFGTVKKWEKTITSFDEMEEDEKDWIFLHEFTRLLPTGRDRQTGVIDRKLEQDLDNIFKELYGDDGYQNYITLLNAKESLVQLERVRKLTTEEEKEMDQIYAKLKKYDLKLLYMKMRNLGYTREELHTSQG